MIGREARALSNTLIAFDADEPQFEKLSDQVVRYLRSKGIMALPTDRPFHVSVSYISKPQEEDDLVGLMEEAEGAGRFHGKKLVPLRGKSGDIYVALQVEASPKFFNFKRKVEDKTKSHGFAKGFKTHISLAKFPASSLEPRLMDQLNEVFNPVFSINSDRVLLYDRSHKVYRSMEANLELIEQLESKNRMSRRAMESLMRRILDRNTKGVFSDNYWTPIHDIQKEFSSEMIDLTLVKSNYFYPKPGMGNVGEIQGKEWLFEIPYTKGGWHLRVVASFGPSPVNDPMSKYDVIYTLSWDGRLKTSSEKLRAVSVKLRSI